MKIFNRILSFFMVVLLLMTVKSYLSSSVYAVNYETENYTLDVDVALADSFVAESSAEGIFSFFSRTQFDGCYGNQISGVAREVYDSLVKNYVTDKKTGQYTYNFKNPLTFKAEISCGSIIMNDELEEIMLELDFALQIAMDAFLYDHPEVFWLKIIGSSYSVSTSGNSADGYTGCIKNISITPVEIYSGAAAKLSKYNTAVDCTVKEITVTENRYDTLKNIHDYICNNAWYNLVNEYRVHSSEPFFIGDGGVVCEGYAKTFKVICDRLDIPCVLVSGDAGGPHMWNYVQMEDGKWYLIDATWDDQQSRIYDTYFLADANTVGFNGVSLSEERTERTDFSGTGMFSFVYPELSATAYTIHTHEWNTEYTVDMEPTCVEKGSKSIHCKSCSAKKNVTAILSKGHTEVTVKGKEATCTSTGLTNGKKCTVCGTVTVAQQTIAKESHSYSNSCDKSCNKCGTTRTVSAHKYSNSCDTTCNECSAKRSIKHTYTNACDKECNVCKAKRSTVHTYKVTTTRATLTKNGKVVKKCTVCGYVSSTTAICYPKSIKLSATTYTYNGKVKAPAVTVKDSKGNALKKDTDYTVKYESGRKMPGKFTVTITFKGKYEGTKRLCFTIAPKATSKITASQTTKTITLKWSKVTGADGYRVYKYNPKTKKYEKLKDVTSTSLKISKLKEGTAYKYKVRAYAKDGDIIWGAYSSAFETATRCKTPSISKLTTTKGKASFTWTNVAGETGYQIYMSTKKDSGFKSVVTTKANVVKAAKSKLTSKKTYYFKVRAYKKTDSGTVYSAFSAVKSVKIK